ncbi:MAG: hypothetical protein Q7T58_03280 [Methylotenera sp.]|nr:hypothetical protein [Methylotenera sp.]
MKYRQGTAGSSEKNINPFQNNQGGAITYDEKGKRSELNRKARKIQT